MSLKKTANSVAIHHFYKSWLPLTDRIKSSIKKGIVSIIGGKKLAKLRQIIQRD